VRVAVLGSTGSIGRQAVDVLAALEDRFEVVALATGRSREAFIAQVARFRPHVVSMADPAGLRDVEVPPGVRIDRTPDAIERMAVRDDVDLVVVGTGGVVSLRPVLAALRAGKIVATANKETLVMGGHLVMPLARQLAADVAARDPRDPMASPLAWVRPIDSEHSAIWQCLAGETLEAVERIWLTASGGPFLDSPRDALARVTPEAALAHPTWRMGAKITIDSATLMNKGLEVIEAHRLYDVDLERISVVIHPQSVIHSAVEFIDGSLKAQLGQPDMRIPIQYALTYPSRRPSPAPRLTLDALAGLTFAPADGARFPALAIARAAGRAGPRACAALISADEVAVERFLAGDLSFAGIEPLVEAAVTRFGIGGSGDPDVEELVALDAAVRAWSETAPVVRAG
jgi:1-deoxy-D-xylulose-5-phosphate reductoisomerase